MALPVNSVVCCFVLCTFSTRHVLVCEVCFDVYVYLFICPEMSLNKTTDIMGNKKTLT